MQIVLTKDDRYVLGKVLTWGGLATDLQFQPSPLYNNEVLTPAGARNSSADVAELVDAHV